jgi:nitrate/nitrite transporter NarK
MAVAPLLEQPAKRKSLYYGWVIVVVGFLAHIASAFSISSTLSVFLKPLSADLGISRGMFSLIRSGEILIGAAAAPVVGTLMDRYGGRWLMAAGGLISGAGLSAVVKRRVSSGSWSCVGCSSVLAIR